MALAVRPRRPVPPDGRATRRLPVSARVWAVLAASVLCLGAAGWVGGSRIGAGSASTHLAAEAPAADAATGEASRPAPNPWAATPGIAAGVAPRPAERSQVREAVAQRIDALHRRLRIVPVEQALWDQFADTMLRDALDSEDRFRSRQSRSALGAAEGLAARAEAAQARADMLGHLSASFHALYEAMPPDQRLLADQVFRQAQRQEGRRGPSRMQQD